MKKLLVKNTFLLTLLFVSVIMSCVELNAQVNDTTQLRYPIPQDDGNPYNQDSNKSGFYLNDPSNVTREIVYDPVTNRYVFYNKIGDFMYRDPYTMSREQYIDYINDKSINDYWKERRETGSTSADAGNQLIPTIYVGGKAFDKIFGSNTIDIKLQGSADVTFGLKSQRRRDPALTVSQQKTTNFDFDMDMQLSASAKIGEKIEFKLNYNTKTQFTFDNKFTLKYEGDEDDIIQLIEAGNVSMPLSSSLITGTQSLFGIKTKLKFGKTSITSVVSYQESETQNIKVSGGALTNEYELECLDYEENRHFFLSQYFRENYEKALANLPLVASDININKIEVWVTNTTSNYENCRNIVAFTDLGEGKEEWIYNSNVQSAGIMGPQYPDDTVNTLLYNMDNSIRSLNTVTSYLTSQGYTSGKDFEKIQKARKLSPSEYVLNSKLGFITLNVNLNANQTLAVAYQYTVIGQDKVYQVGEFSDQSISDPNLLVTKLLKSTTINTKMPMWDLMMKNVYNIRAYQVSPSDFVMNVLYIGNDNGVATGYFADAKGDVKGQSLLHLMNMDNLNSQMNPVEGGDGMFDFINGATTNGGTINAATGRIYFTVLEPFGSHIREIFKDDPALADKYAFDSLYTLTKTSAEQFTDKNKFRLEGHYTSSSGSEINLNALNVEPGSVTVTAGGVPLTENVDYTVDYTLGRVIILNEALLNSGTGINISLENNTAISTMKKTFLGSRIEHEISPDFLIGGTILHLSERAYTTKVNYNDEPLSNTIYGFDFNYQTESQLLTDLIDKLPLIETKQKSRISVYGEFAHFIQGINKETGQTGTSYIDDFEGAKSTIDLRQWSSWNLASTPQHQHNLFPEAFSTIGLDYGKNRSKLAWYTIDHSVFYDRYGSLLPPNISNDELSDHRVRQILETEIFPNRDIQAGASTNVSVLNLAYYPDERGPYNYDTDNVNSDGTFSNPEDRWGGIMRAIESSDFNATNVEYIEFWMMDPFYEGQDQSNTGKLYFNLGDISEDILRDGRKAYENGLPTTADVVNVDTTSWGRVPSLQALVDAFDSNPDSRQYQDVGYDGLSDNDERSFFKNYLDVLQQKLSPEAYAKTFDDPSSDNYHYFRGSDYDANSKYSSILERYKLYNGNEGNSPSEVQYTESYTTNNTTLPDVEDINNDNTLSESENYYQYEIDIDPMKMMNAGQNRISDIRTATVTTLNGDVKTVRWYQFRIPIREPDAVVGNIEGYSSIRFMRIFMKDFKDDIVLRFATLDLVRGEWRTYTQAIQAPGEYVSGDQSNNTLFEMSAVNLEENSSREPVPYVIPPGIYQEVYTGTVSTIRQNEQALQLSVENLTDGDARAVYKTTSFDFRYYKKMKMFVHAEKMYEHDDLEDGDLTVFLRFGSDLTDNYYEYEVPLKFTEWYTSSTDDFAIWPEENNIEIDFEELVEVKNNRNKSLGKNNVQTNREYTEYSGKNKIKVLGNPTISEVRNMMIGVRNPKNNNEADTDKSAIIWINELRLTDLNNQGGWAATGRIEATLADLGRVSASGSYNSAGYGSLETKVTESQMESNSFYNVSADIDLGKFMKQEKTGITVPIHYDQNQTTITPEYNPFDPDVKFKDALNNVETKEGRDSLKFAAKDVVKQTNFNITNLRKTRVGKKKPHFWDIENFNASYAYRKQEQRDSDIEYAIDKSHRGGINYTYSTNPKNVQPFAKAKWASSQYLKLIKDFNFYYLPKSFSFSTEMYRQYQEQKLRNKSSGALIIKPTYAKSWDWNRNYDFRYDITKGLNFTYNASANAYIYEPTGNPERETAEWTANRDTIRDEIFGLGSISRFNQTSKLNYTIPVNKLPFMEWVTSNASYTGIYRWTASSRSTQSIMGNLNENEQTIQFNANADLTKLYNKVPYFKEVLTPKRNNNRARQPKIEDEVKSADTTKRSPKKNYAKIIGDGAIRVLLSVKKVSFTFSQGSGVSLPGYMMQPDYIGLNSITGAPGLGFVLGWDRDILDKAIAGNWLTTDSTFNQAYSERFNENYNYKVTLEPFPDLKIDVSGMRNYVENFSEYFRADANGVFNFFTPSNGGNFSMSYLMTATSFKDSDELFNTLLTNRQDIAYRLARENEVWIGLGEPEVYDSIGKGFFPYGYGASSQEVLMYSFLAAYSGQDIDEVGLTMFKKFALPNWTVNFSGLTKIPAVKKIFKTFNITHSYKSNYSISTWASNINYVEENPLAVYEGTNIKVPEYDIAQIVVSEQYAPLIGVNMSFANNLAPSFEYKKSRSLTLSFINNQLTEVEGREIIIGCGYTFKDLGIVVSSGSGNSKRNTNDLVLKLDIGFRKDITTLRSIDENYSQISSGQNRINIYLTADYDFSSRLGMQAFFKRDVTDPFVANSFKTSNTFAGVTLRFSLTQ
ncbi:MAG: cell surface protein SprA [Lentimicrobiaceae bacterium]|nr:cell surface protein SprA [Lentimicrobiaceae bacterium]